MGLVDSQLVPLGKVSGVLGLQGWIKVFSDTDPREGIIDYRQWILLKGDKQDTVVLEKGKRHGKGVVVKLEGINDRSAAELLIGRTIAVHRDELPKLAEDEHYWSDLIGLEVITTQGVVLGVVASLFATGANDVVVVKGERERLVPWIRGQVVIDINMDSRKLTVDWDPDF